MGDEDLELLAFAEKDSNPNEWAELTYFEGNCLIGCEGRKLLKTRNMLAALRWADYHREGAEHVGNLQRRGEPQRGDIEKLPEIAGSIMLPTNPPKEG